MIEIAMTIEMTQDDSLYISTSVIDKDFFFADGYKKHATHKVVGKEYAFYIEERCYANLTRQQAINLCKRYVDTNRDELERLKNEN